MIKQLIGLIYIFVPQVILSQGKTTTNKEFETIAWDQSSLRQVAPQTGSGNANYARMVQLSNGSLLCVYENSGNVECILSNDLGNKWQEPAVIAFEAEGINMATPEILELKDRSLLVSYNPRPRKINGGWDTTKHFAIRTKKSYDGGKTWKDDRLIYEAGYKFEDGCWEPAQIQLPSGEIQLYFSDEGIYTTSNEQNISMLNSFDNGLTWNKKPKIVSFNPGHRDGMPVPIILVGSRQILFSIEDNGRGQFKPAVIRQRFDQNWQKLAGADDMERTQALVPELPDTVYAGAPYLRRLRSGQTILSYQSTMNRSSNWERACMQVAVGDSNGNAFKNVETPFRVPFDKHGLWNSLCVLGDDTIIALTSTNSYTGGTAIWMIKGRLVTKN